MGFRQPVQFDICHKSIYLSQSFVGKDIQSLEK